MDNKKFEQFKRSQIKIAKELCYGREVKEKLENAKTEYEIDRIMVSARKNIAKPFTVARTGP